MAPTGKQPIKFPTVTLTFAGLILKKSYKVVVDTLDKYVRENPK